MAKFTTCYSCFGIVTDKDKVTLRRSQKTFCSDKCMKDYIFGNKQCVDRREKGLVKV
jgi:hypothetical protein